MNKKILIKSVDDVLRPIGFHRKGVSWNRRSDAFVEVVELTVGKFGTDYTFSLGVWIDGPGTRIWGDKFSGFVPEPACPVRCRIGRFLDPPRDAWWNFADDESVDQFEELLLRRGVPFLVSMRSKLAVEGWLSDRKVTKKYYPPPIITLALLKIDRGDVGEGCRILRGLAASVEGDWKQSVDDLVDELCGSSA